MLSTFPRPISDLVKTTVPVWPFTESTLLSRAVCTAVEIGLFKSEVLSTFPKPISDLVKTTVPVWPFTEPTALDIAGK